MDIEEVKSIFYKSSSKVIFFLSNMKKVSYVSTLLVIDNEISAHSSNGFAGWDKKFYYDGYHKDSLLIKIGIELTKIKKNETSTVIWDDALKISPNDRLKKLREENGIFHGISFIYGVIDTTSISINTCTYENVSKESFENFILPLRFELLNFFNELSNV